MYYDERIQGGIFTPVLVVTDRSIFVELEAGDEPLYSNSNMSRA